MESSSYGIPLMPQAVSSIVAPSTNRGDLELDDISDAEITMMMLRKPTELKKVIDSLPKPIRAVPKNGLPIWYKIGLESKLPVPKMPEGKIVFSRGKMGEDVRRIGLGADNPNPTFDLTDPYCYNVSYDYASVHDPHLAFYYQQKPAKNRMKSLGFATKDGRAVCTLKEFNLYRKYLYNRFMDRIHMEIEKLDERAKDDLMLKKVEADVARRAVAFARRERARAYMEKHAQLFADEEAEKKRYAKEQEKKVEARMKYLAEFNEKNRKDRMARMQEKETRIRQRVQAAAEMELRRKISMIRQWRTNEKRRLIRQKSDREAKLKRIEDEANRKWQQRVESQNRKIQEENLLLHLYTEDMNAGARRRQKRAEVYAYNTDLQLQCIRIANLRAMHGGAMKSHKLVKKMGTEFERSKRGAKGMSPALAQRMATEAMYNAGSTAGDVLMTLGQARARMDMETVLPTAPIKILDQMLETAVIEFARRRIHLLLVEVERVVHNKALSMFYNKTRYSNASSSKKKKARSKPSRYSGMLTTKTTNKHTPTRRHSIGFGEVALIPAVSDVDYDLKKSKYRPPTPVPSLTKLAEVTFTDRVEDLPDPVTLASFLPERKKLLEMVHAAARLLSRFVSLRVDNGMDLIIGNVTLPNVRHRMEWGEAVEGLADAVVNNRVHADSVDIRHAGDFLALRVLRELQVEMKTEKTRLKRLSTLGASASSTAHHPHQDFYVPGQSRIQTINTSPTQQLQFSDTTEPTTEITGPV